MNSNFKHHYLLMLSLLVGVAVPSAVIAQAPISNIGSGSVGDRVAQLERVSDAHGQLLLQLQQQISDSQREIETLRGQIQESQYQLNQLVERQKHVYRQMDSSTPMAGETSLNAPAVPKSTNSTPAGAVASSGTVTNSEHGVAANNGDEESDYKYAVSLALEKKQFDQAITVFQRFLKQYPTSTYLPNANYWLGQLYYNQGKKDEAAYYYAVVVKNHPKSPKSSDAMFKVGMIKQAQGYSDEAKAVYQQVIKQYPTTDTAKQAEKQLSMF